MSFSFLVYLIVLSLTGYLELETDTEFMWSLPQHINYQNGNRSDTD
jgi:glycopeptide antibiotics resistance protein